MDIGGLGSTYLDYANSLTSTSGKSASSISSLDKKDLTNATDEELMEVCKEFEAYFMEMIMKEMTSTTSLLGEESSGSNSSLVNYFKDSAITDLAKTATEQNSLGLAQTLYEQMRRNYGLDSAVVTTPGDEKMSTEKATEIEPEKE
nr:rod-binding protein [Lachnospiraceae bacterium]